MPNDTIYFSTLYNSHYLAPLEVRRIGALRTLWRFIVESADLFCGASAYELGVTGRDNEIISALKGPIDVLPRARDGAKQLISLT